MQNELVKAKGGVAFLARETQSLVVPVLIQGIEDFSFAAFLGGKRKLIIHLLGNHVGRKNSSSFLREEMEKYGLDYS